MTETFKERLAMIVVVTALAAWAYHSWIVQPEKQRQRSKERRTEVAQRFENWAYVAKEREIAPGETIRLVVIPGARSRVMDTKCFIYTHREFRTSSMICPDADRNFIDTEDPPT